MNPASVLISYYLRNGVRVDDLGLLIVLLAIVILSTGVIRRAAHILAWLMFPAEFVVLRPNAH
ncbi:hypothetical protein F5148DRAFT_1284530 [Russula earlei]|uniref:Uncharacterized protein n=1 Tax=Russula earlei TaxID=71964 RepID=A0ACC0U984_9AGAM|nr:hypothetical protein F5148DRAFT_1284530 [Russula earlei]